MNRQIKRQLEQLTEPEYQKFQQKLLPDVEGVLGVRLPHLRKMAKKIAGGDWEKYLAQAEDDSFEEIMLQGMVIGYLNEDLAEVLPYIVRFVPKINNWSVCDSFCSGLKIAKRHKEEMLEFVLSYLNSESGFHIRFGVVMLLWYYAEPAYIDTVLKHLNRVKSEDYYVKMAVAWAVSICYIKLPESTKPFLMDNALDGFTYKKALQKILESQAITEELKKDIRKLYINA